MILFVVIWLGANAPLPSGVIYSCEDVRAYVQANGRAYAYARAGEMILAGQLSWKQFRAAKRCADMPTGSK